MKENMVRIISLGLIVLAFILGWYFYPQLPESAASHWNTRGEVDGYLSRFWGAFLLPLVMAIAFFLLQVVPLIDPKRENIEKFKKHYNGFVLLFLVFFFYLYVLTLVWNLGFIFDLVSYMIPAFTVLFFYTGILISHAEPNWTIGIRTPWTISNPTVWKKTHDLGGKLFRWSALIGLFGLLIPSYAFWIVIIPIIFSALWSVVYSYLEYKKIN